MNGLMIRMTVHQGKRNELLQAVKSLTAQMRKHGRCVELSFAQDVEHEDTFWFQGLWHTRQDMEADVQTELFAVLLGGIQVLCDPPEFVVRTDVVFEGKEVIESIKNAGIGKVEGEILLKIPEIKGRK